MREKPEGKTYWNPYSRKMEPVLTDEEISEMWPYAKRPLSQEEKETLDMAGIEEKVTRGVNLGATAVANVLASDNAAPPPDDMVTMPHHYARFKIEPIRFIVENGLNFCQANIIKYVMRWDAKNGLEDLRKARRYIDMFIQYAEGNPDWWKK